MPPCQGVSWVPGHKQLLVERVIYKNPPSSEIWLTSANGRAIRKVTSVYPDQVRFFASGLRGSAPLLAIATDKNGIDIINLSTRADSFLKIGAPADSLAFSPDGSRIAFVADSNQHAIPITLYVAKTSGKAAIRAVLPASNYRFITDPSWSPDGRWIAAGITVMHGSTDADVAIWLMHPDGSGLHKLVSGVAPQWSPDGKWVSYIGTAGMRSALFKIHPDGTGRVRLTRYTEADTGSSVDESSQPSW
jgi:dipeptidyl aminopeptidase/acylaminoacyl peptidase